MTFTVKTYSIQTEQGLFNFSNKDSMYDFEKNNWKEFGETSYSLVLIWDDGTETTEDFFGINASANLEAYLND